VYFKDVPRADAERLGKVLQDVQIFNNTGAKTVQLLKRDGLFVVNFAVVQGAWDQPQHIANTRHNGLLLAARAFPGSPLEMGLCDRNMKVRRAVPIEPTNRKLFGPQEEVLFSSSLQQEADKLGKALQEIHYFNNLGGKSVHLLKRDAVTVVHFYVQNGIWEKQQNIDAFTAIGRMLARRAFPEKALEVGLCDSLSNVHRTLAFEPTSLMTFGPREEIEYTSSLKKEAEQLGKAMQKMRLFDGTKQQTVTLTKRDDTWVVHFIVVAGAWDNPPAVEFWRMVADSVRNQVFLGSAVEFSLCDQEYIPRKTFTIR
jgi:hypothetical protein